jgi:hypothetical protein
MAKLDKAKASGGYETAAIRNLQRARKAINKEVGPEATTELLISSANVYAILDLADAIRAVLGSGVELPGIAAPGTNDVPEATRDEGERPENEEDTELSSAETTSENP